MGQLTQAAAQAELARLAAELGMTQVFIKDESRLPTGSFKARGMALAVSMASALQADKALVERLRWSDGWFFENPWDHVVYASDDPLEAADRIEAQEVEIERLQDALKRIAGGWPKPMQLARETLEK